MKTEIINAVKLLLQEGYSVDPKLISDVFTHLEKKCESDKHRRQDVVAGAITTFMAQQEEQDLELFSLKRFFDWIKK